MLLHPYLVFNGNAQEAIRLYTETLGLEVAFLQKYGSVSDMTYMPPGYEDKIMHASLKGDNFEILISDTTPDRHVDFGFGGHKLAIMIDSVSRGKEIFTALSSHGVIVEEYTPRFWGATYGVCTDRFGVQWTVNAEEK